MCRAKSSCTEPQFVIIHLIRLIRVIIYIKSIVLLIVEYAFQSSVCLCLPQECHRICLQLRIVRKCGCHHPLYPRYFAVDGQRQNVGRPCDLSYNSELRLHQDLILHTMLLFNPSKVANFTDFLKSESKPARFWSMVVEASASAFRDFDLETPLCITSHCDCGSGVSQCFKRLGSAILHHSTSHVARSTYLRATSATLTVR